MADELLELVRKLDSTLDLKYNKFYIGLAKAGLPNNFVIFRPLKSFIKVEVRLPNTEAQTAMLESAGLEVMDYDIRWGRYRLRKGELKKNVDRVNVLRQFFEAAYQESGGQNS